MASTLESRGPGHSPPSLLRAPRANPTPLPKSPTTLAHPTSAASPHISVERAEHVLSDSSEAQSSAHHVDDDDCNAGSSDHITHWLRSIDRRLAGLNLASSDIIARPTQSSPAPLDVRNSTSSLLTGRLELPPANQHRPLRRRHHTSDSGIGSSESSESVQGDGKDVKEIASTSGPVAASVHDQASAEELSWGRGINGRTQMASDDSSESMHRLSPSACRQIQKHIILPILRRQNFKTYHPLVNGLPIRVARKEITCLRDLEKVLLWLAPRFSPSKTSFLRFCETSIQCLHVTADHLDVADQRRPTDRPYTEEYFDDLVAQVRRYATMASASRDTSSSTTGETSPRNTPVLPSGRVSLVGGLSRTGRPAELVVSDGRRHVSLRSLNEMSSAEYNQLNHDGEEHVSRSMARRHKAIPVPQNVPTCRLCRKSFRRPCDLTKHEKTHSRPWKCSEPACKYHALGWPTEKERDRHVNDKHSASPATYKCHFDDCGYESKRESNCKQHMEKAHGWTYVRSKKSGKISPGNSVTRSPAAAPMMPTPDSRTFRAPSSEVGESVASPNSAASISDKDHDDVSSTTSHFHPADPAHFSMSPIAFSTQNVDNSYSDSVAGAEAHDFLALDGSSAMPSGTFDFSEDASMFGADFDWSHADPLQANANLQLASPAISAEALALTNVQPEFRDLLNDGSVPSLSPVGRGDAMLYTPGSMIESDIATPSTLHEFMPSLQGRPMHDFQLMESSPKESATIAPEMLFGELNSLSVGQVGSSQGFDISRSPEARNKEM